MAVTEAEDFPSSGSFDDAAADADGGSVVDSWAALDHSAVVAAAAVVEVEFAVVVVDESAGLAAESFDLK